ncbi:MAG: acetoacetate decarboxylase family protein [bacterium]|nr:acetoacetate decarboxylase family protein [bacterium]
MPAHFGRRLTGKASAEYLDVTTMAVSYLTDPVKLAQYLPEPFEVGSEPRVTVFYSMNHEIEWLAGGNYNLLGVNAAVRFNGKTDRLEGAYCLVLWEDETDPILTGRELLGIPKIYADIEDPAVLRGTWRTSASHRNHKIVDMSIRGLKPLPAETIAAFKSSSKKANWMGWKYIPNTGRGGAAVSHATLVPTSASPREAWTGTGEIDWNRLTWEQNPTQAHIVNALADLPVLEYGPAFVSRGATGLRVPGRQVKELH